MATKGTQRPVNMRADLQRYSERDRFPRARKAVVIVAIPTTENTCSEVLSLENAHHRGHGESARGSKRLRTGFARANANSLGQVVDEDLAVANLAGLG